MVRVDPVVTERTGVGPAQGPAARRRVNMCMSRQNLARHPPQSHLDRHIHDCDRSQDELQARVAPSSSHQSHCFRALAARMGDCCCKPHPDTRFGALSTTSPTPFASLAVQPHRSLRHQTPPSCSAPRGGLQQRKPLRFQQSPPSYPQPFHAGGTGPGTCVIDLSCLVAAQLPSAAQRRRVRSGRRASCLQRLPRLPEWLLPPAHECGVALHISRKLWTLRCWLCPRTRRPPSAAEAVSARKLTSPPSLHARERAKKTGPRSMVPLPRDRILNSANPKLAV